MIEKFAPWSAGIAVVFGLGFVSWCLALIGGWRRLAEIYSTREPADGKVYSMQSAVVGQVHYRSCLTIALLPVGLRLAMWPMFLPLGHPTLLIPWSDFHGIRKRRSFFMKLDEVTIGNPPVATLCFRPHILSAAREIGYLKEEAESREQAVPK